MHMYVCVHLIVNPGNNSRLFAKTEKKQQQQHQYQPTRYILVSIIISIQPKFKQANLFS